MRKTKDGFWEESLDDMKARMKRFEEYYGVTSEEFLKRWKEGNFEDTFWTNLWLADILFLKKAEAPEVVLESDND